MNARPIIDAGPGLNFFSINKERLLISVLGKLSAPEIVRDEVFRKAQQDERFRHAAAVWKKLNPTWMEVLSDDETLELAKVIQRITRQPMEQRLKNPKDLGEMMVIAHAVVAAESGSTVTILIDDGPGARIATSEINRLKRRGDESRVMGGIRLVNSLIVLERAAGAEHIPDKAAMRDIYKRLRALDDGLPPIEKTSLLSLDQWRVS